MIYENRKTDTEKEDVLSYIFGLPHRRQVRSLELLTPARTLWDSDVYQQNAWTMLNRTHTTLRANLLLALANCDQDLFLDYLRIKLPLMESWRKGAVDRLSAWRELLKTQAPEQLDVLSDLIMPTLRRAVYQIKQVPTVKTANDLRSFISVYTALRYVGLFSPPQLADSAADVIRVAVSKLPQDGSPESLMLKRALERPLHLLHLPEEWDNFIDELLDWLDDPQGEGAVFAAYTACYYLDSLDVRSWKGMVVPYSIEQAWTNKAVHTLLEESSKNLNESWYRAPHQAAINMLRAINYLTAHPDLRLGYRERIVCQCLANAGAAAVKQLSHPRKIEINRWSEWLKRLCSTTF